MSTTMIENQQLTDSELKQSIQDFIKGRDTGFLGTMGAQGMRVSPVKYFVDDDLNVYVHSKGGTKFDNIEQNKTVCMLVCTPFRDDFDKIKGVQIFGNAEVAPAGSTLFEQGEELCPWQHPDDVKLIKINTTEVVYVDRLSKANVKQVWKH